MERTSIRVFIVSSRSELTERILSVLMPVLANRPGLQADFAIVGLVRSLEDAIRQAQQASPDIVLVGESLEGQEERLRRLAIEAPAASVIALCPREDTRAAQRALLAGARAFVPDPFDDAELLTVIREVHTLEMERRARLGEEETRRGREGETRRGDVPGPLASLSQRGRVWALLSPKGGSGRSTIAANLAILLHQETHKEVILIDAHRSLGDLDTLLNLVPTSTLADLGPEVSDVDEGLLRTILLKHISGIYVMLAPQQIDERKSVYPTDRLPDPTGFEHILDLARQMFDYVVVDTGPLTDPYTSVVLQYADHLLLITVPEMPALQRTSLFMEAARQYGFPSERISLVVNRSTARGGITQQQIRERLGTETIFTVPEDIPLITYSINQGIPLVLSHPKSAVAFSLSQMTKGLIAGESPLAPSGRASGRSLAASTLSPSGGRAPVTAEAAEPVRQTDERTGGDSWRRLTQRFRRKP